MSLSLCIISWMLYFTYQNVRTEAIAIDELKCSFEAGFCMWTNVSAQWTTDRYSYINQQTGPQEDGGKDGSYYVYVPPMSTNDNNEIAELESVSVSGDSSSSKTCFRFWYYMFGSHVQNLTITSGSTLKFSRFGDQGSNWSCGIFDVTGISGKITFNVYRTDRQTKPYSVIAIDHIEILHSSTCSQESCETIESVSTTGTSVTSPSTTTITTTNAQPPDLSGEGVTDLLPIVIGVPCGVLIVGGIIVGICLNKRRRSSKDIVRTTTTSNPYTGSPRQSGDYAEEEVYNEIDENEIGVYNGGYIEPVSYDEIKDVTLKGNDTVEYVNQTSTIPQDEEDYLTPSGGICPPGLTRHSINNNIRNGQPNNSDYLDLDTDNF